MTSACIRARGLPDDCEELMTLRRFRDEWVANTPQGSGEIREYYRLAPQIVKAVNARPDAPEVWDRIYRELVLECMDLIRKGKSGETYRLYKSYTLSLAEELL